MPAVYEIELLPVGPVTKFYGTRGNSYEFDDGSHLDVHTTPVWCHRCREITHGEDIETLAEIDKRLSDLHDPSSELYRYYQMPFLPELDKLCPGEARRLNFIEDLKKRRQWRENRRSAPKCIYCGSTHIFVFPFGQEVSHPAGQGTIKIGIVGMCSTSFNEWFFTPEGDRIPRDTKPTYWHHPGE